MPIKVFFSPMYLDICVAHNVLGTKKRIWVCGVFCQFPLITLPTKSRRKVNTLEVTKWLIYVADTKSFAYVHSMFFKGIDF